MLAGTCIPVRLYIGKICPLWGFSDAKLAAKFVLGYDFRAAGFRDCTKSLINYAGTC